MSKHIQKRTAQSAKAKMPHLKARLQYWIQYNWEEQGILNRLQVYHFPVERGPERQTQVALGICSSDNPSLSQLDATIHVPSCCSWSCYSVGVTLKMLLVYLVV